MTVKFGPYAVRVLDGPVGSWLLAATVAASMRPVGFIPGVIGSDGGAGGLAVGGASVVRYPVAGNGGSGGSCAGVVVGVGAVVGAVVVGGNSTRAAPLLGVCVGVVACELFVVPTPPPISISHLIRS